MPAPKARQEIQAIPLPMVGGSKFGRYNKISREMTWNFIVSDDWLVPYAGYKNVLDLFSALEGRGLYRSVVGNFMIGIIGSNVSKIIASPSGMLSSLTIGQLFTNQDDAYISENNNRQIVITDGQFLYVYDYNSGIPGDLVFTSSKAGTVNEIPTPPDNPGYISFQNGQLLVASLGTTNWRLSSFNDARSWPTTSPFVGSLQSKPDFIQAVVPIPGGGNNALVMGSTVTEIWQYTAAAKFPYQRNSTFNIDFGCLNASSIAHLKDYIVWLAINEQSGPVIMVSRGNGIEQISTDGINYQLGNLKNPRECTAFLYQQDGHVLYQFTFNDPQDNASYAYDFETGLFFNVSDENLNYHIAREVVYFNNTYYFVSLNGGNIYEFDTQFSFAQYGIDSDIRSIPRIRICPPLRMPNQRYFIIKSIGFTIENGLPNTIRKVNQITNIGDDLSTEDLIFLTTEDGNLIEIEKDQVFVTYEYSSNKVSLAISRNGAQTFGSFWEKDMNHTGGFASRFIWQRLGHANDASIQIRFNGTQRFTATNGEIEIYE